MSDDSGVRRRRVIREIKSIAENAPEAGIETVDPSAVSANLSAENIDGDADTATEQGELRPKRRGRKPGAQTKARKIDAGALESLLLSVHFGLSAVLSVPEMALDGDEATKLASAAEKVSRHYDVPGLPEKMIDWSNLLIVMAMVYGPRFAAIRMRKAEERKAAKAKVVNPVDLNAPIQGL